LEVISVEGHIVTIDAIGTQKEIAKKIVEKKGDYVLAVNKNQADKYEEIKTYFEDKNLLKKIEEEEIYVETTDGGQGLCRKFCGRAKKKMQAAS
jgi:predicted transposase YbfD/YdcC